MEWACLSKQTFYTNLIKMINLIVYKEEDYKVRARVFRRMFIYIVSEGPSR